MGKYYELVNKSDLWWLIGSLLSLRWFLLENIFPSTTKSWYFNWNQTNRNRITKHALKVGLLSHFIKFWSFAPIRSRIRPLSLSFTGGRDAYSWRSKPFAGALKPSPRCSQPPLGSVPFASHLLMPPSTPRLPTSRWLSRRQRRSPVRNRHLSLLQSLMRLLFFILLCFKISYFCLQIESWCVSTWWFVWGEFYVCDRLISTFIVVFFWILAVLTISLFSWHFVRLIRDVIESFYWDLAWLGRLVKLVRNLLLW